MDIRYLASAGYQLWTCGLTISGVGGSGVVEIEPGFQIISTPTIYGYWSTVEHKHIHDNSTIATVYNYIDLQISDVYGVATNTMIEVYNTLIGGQGNYWNFVPGVTNPLSPHNFNLSYYDSGADSQEIVGYFVKSIHPTAFTITWGER